VHRRHQRAAQRAANGAALLGRPSADLGLDLIQGRDPAQSLLGKRRFGCNMNVVELAPRVALACHSTR
jgi:hypothetical protein